MKRNYIYSIYKSEKGYEKMMALYSMNMSKWTVPYKEMDVKTSWGATHIIKSGLKNKKPLIVLHGGGCNSSLEYIEISDLTRDYIVYAIDILGEPGKTMPHKLPKKPIDLAEWLNEVFLALDIKEADIYGVSYGGLTALWFLHLYPQKVKKMAIVSYTYMDQRPPIMNTLKLIYYALTSGNENAMKLIRFMNNGPMKDKDFEKILSSFTGNRIKHTHINSINVYNSVPADSIIKIEKPVLIIMGEKDCLFNARKAVQYLKNINNSNIRYEVIEGLGHIPFDKRETIMSRVLEFF